VSGPKLDSNWDEPVRHDRGGIHGEINPPSHGGYPLRVSMLRASLKMSAIAAAHAFEHQCLDQASHEAFGATGLHLLDFPRRFVADERALAPGGEDHALVFEELVRARHGRLSIAPGSGLRAPGCGLWAVGLGL